MNKSKESFGENLRREIRRKHLKFAEAAELLDISLGFLNKMMNGESTPSLDMVYNIIRKLEISADALFFGDSRPVIERHKEVDPIDLINATQIAQALNDMSQKISILTEKPHNEAPAASLNIGVTGSPEYQRRLAEMKSKLRQYLKDGAPRPEKIDAMMDDLFPTMSEISAKKESAG